MNYHNKIFRPVSSSKNSNTTPETIFVYQQQGSILTSTYSGGQIVSGHLIGQVDSKGNITMHYHHITTDGALRTGICTSTPEVLPNGKLLLHETWEWTSGDCSKGHSKLEEL